LQQNPTCAYAGILLAGAALGAGVGDDMGAGDGLSAAFSAVGDCGGLICIQ